MSLPAQGWLVARPQPSFACDGVLSKNCSNDCQPGVRLDSIPTHIYPASPDTAAPPPDVTICTGNRQPKRDNGSAALFLGQVMDIATTHSADAAETRIAEGDVTAGDRAPVPRSDLVVELTAVERMLARTPVVAVGEYRCPPDNPQFRGGGPETCPYVVFSRSSVRLLPSRGPAEICTPVTVNLLDVGDSYARQAIGNASAHCDWIAISPTLLREIAGLASPKIREGSQSVFRRCVAPISSATYLSQRIFFSRVRRFCRAEIMALEENAIRLVESAIRESTSFGHADSSSSATGVRVNSPRARDIVERTKSILAQEYWCNPSVADIAARVHCSPAYLSRVFSRLAGLTLHQYQQQIRLRTSLELIAEQRFNGAGIAAQLGFASHSHFTDAFRRCFGFTPTSFAKSVTVSSLRDTLRAFDRRRLLKSQRKQALSIPA